MLVRDWMTEGSQNLGLETSLIDAAEIMRRRNIRQLPVIDATGALQGILSDRDVRDAMPSKYLPGDAGSMQGAGLLQLKVKDVMSIDPVTISPDAPVESAALLLQQGKIGGLPVVDDEGSLTGIITEVDVYRYFCSVSGFTQEGLQLVFQLEDKPGAAIELLSFLKDQDIRLISVLTSYNRVPAGFRHVSIRIQGSGRHNLGSLITMLESRYPLVYVLKDGRLASAT